MSSIPKVSINDLIQSTNNSTNMVPSAQMSNQPNANNPVANFISTLAKYAHTGTNDVKDVLYHTPILQHPSSPSLGQVGEDFIKGYQHPDALPTSLAGGVGAIAGMPDPLNPKADLGAVNDVSQGIKETLLGGKTAEEIKAAKEAPISLLTKTGDNIAPLSQNIKSPVRIALKPSVYGAGREAAVQKTVDTIVPGESAAKKYANLQPTMDNLGNQIDSIMQQNPKLTSLDQLMKDYDLNLQNEGVYRTSSTTKSGIQEQAQKYITDLQSEASGGNTLLNPNQISDVSLQKIKQQVNQDAQSIYKKIDNGTSLTDKDRVILAARQTLDDTLTTLHPEIKQLTTQQSHLYDAADSLYNGRESELKTAAKTAHLPPLIRGVKNIYDKQPWLIKQAETLGVGALGYNEAKNLPTQIGALSGAISSTLSNTKDQQSSSTIQSPSIPSPKYSANTPIDDGSIMNEQDFGQKQAALEQKIGAEKLYNPQQANIDQGTYDSNKATYDSQANIRQLSTDTQGFINSANNASTDIAAADPSVMNALNQGFDAFSKANGGKYAKMAADLKALSNLSGVDLSTAKSKEALQSAIDAIVQNQQAKLKAGITTYGGNNSHSQPLPTSLPSTPHMIQQAPINWQQNDPRAQAILNQ